MAHPVYTILKQFQNWSQVIYHENNILYHKNYRYFIVLIEKKRKSSNFFGNKKNSSLRKRLFKEYTYNLKFILTKFYYESVIYQTKIKLNLILWQLLNIFIFKLTWLSQDDLSSFILPVLFWIKILFGSISWNYLPVPLVLYTFSGTKKPTDFNHT